MFVVTVNEKNRSLFEHMVAEEFRNRGAADALIVWKSLN